MTYPLSHYTVQLTCFGYDFISLLPHKKYILVYILLFNYLKNTLSLIYLRHFLDIKTFISILNQIKEQNKIILSKLDNLEKKTICNEGATNNFEFPCELPLKSRSDLTDLEEILKTDDQFNLLVKCTCIYSNTAIHLPSFRLSLLIFWHNFLSY